MKEALVFEALERQLDRLGDAGGHMDFWLRDDDAVEPSAPLEHLVDLTAKFSVPTLLAVIPAFTGGALARRLETEALVSVAVHGWSHHNYAGESEKSQELGGHRPADVVLGELQAGYERLAELYGPQFVPVLVPPWNRIDSGIMLGLPQLGFRALSVFGEEKPAPLPMLNTHVDIIDWRGTRGARPHDVLVREIAARLIAGKPVTGVLTHHLVHDASAWDFLERLFEVTSGHQACRWCAAHELF